MITRTITVTASRLPVWLDGFDSRHGPGHTEPDQAQLVITAADGAVAKITTAYLAMPDLDADHGRDLRGQLLDHLAQPRTVGALLVRRNGYGVGVFEGTTLVSSKIGSRYVQGKTKAGGWSQQRFVRRRDNQAQALYDAAADQADRLLIPRLADLEAVIIGGDRAGIDAVLEDRRLLPLRPMIRARIVAVPDPKHAVLAALPATYTSVEIGLNELA